MYLQVADLENKLVAVGFSACSNSQLREFVNQLNQYVLESPRDSSAPSQTNGMCTFIQAPFEEASRACAKPWTHDYSPRIQQISQDC